MDEAEIKSYVARLREETADLLRDLTPEQWDTPSLCKGWTVRDVAAHMSVMARSSPQKMLAGLARARGNPNRMVADEAREHAAAHEPGELVAELRLAANNFSRPLGTTRVDPLVDVIVHTLDITVPLGIAWTPPTDAAIASANRLTRTALLFGAAKRLKGLRLEATDADWSHGDGRVVRGPIETLLLLLAGRTVALTDLEGEGVELLRERGL